MNFMKETEYSPVNKYNVTEWVQPSEQVLLVLLLLY